MQARAITRETRKEHGAIGSDHPCPVRSAAFRDKREVCARLIRISSAQDPAPEEVLHPEVVSHVVDVFITGVLPVEWWCNSFKGNKNQGLARHSGGATR